MAARTIVFDRLVLSGIRLTRNNSDPVQAEVTYEIAGTNGEFARTITFTPQNIPGGIQTQLNNLWAQAETAARGREGL